MYTLHGAIMNKKKKDKERIVVINRAYTLTSPNGSDEDLDIVEQYLTRTCLDQESLQKFAEIFNVQMEFHNEVY